MESVRVRENPKDYGWNLGEYRRTLRIRNRTRSSTREPEALWMESRRVPENPKDKEWNPYEYGRTRKIMDGISASTGEP